MSENKGCSKWVYCSECIVYVENGMKPCERAVERPKQIVRKKYPGEDTDYYVEPI